MKKINTDPPKKTKRSPGDERVPPCLACLPPSRSTGAASAKSSWTASTLPRLLTWDLAVTVRLSHPFFFHWESFFYKTLLLLGWFSIDEVVVCGGFKHIFHRFSPLSVEMMIQSDLQISNSVFENLPSWWPLWPWIFTLDILPMASMYATFTYIYDIDQPNV